MLDTEVQLASSMGIRCYSGARDKQMLPETELEQKTICVGSSSSSSSKGRSGLAGTEGQDPVGRNLFS